MTTTGVRECQAVLLLALLAACGAEQSAAATELDDDAHLHLQLLQQQRAHHGKEEVDLDWKEDVDDDVLQQLLQHLARRSEGEGDREDDSEGEKDWLALQAEEEAIAELDRQLQGALEDALEAAKQWLLSEEEDGNGKQTRRPEEGRAHRVRAGTRALVEDNGYPVEEYTVRTDDGYLLGVFRMPRPGRPVVFLMHGILASSADYVLAGKDRALAMVLYDAGFDVWLGNARGSTSSRRHEHLTTEQPAFWDFTWHEIGTLDLPACIDHVLAATNQSSLHVVAHSQGTTTFFVLGSERPEYMAAKVRTYTALAPVAFVRDITSVPLRFMGKYSVPLGILAGLVGMKELLPNSKLITWAGDHFCADGAFTQPLCARLIFSICGTDPAQFNATLLPDMLVNLPAGGSLKQLKHYGQLLRNRKLIFRQFDYGLLGNLRRYGRLSPPHYDLSKLSVPTYLVYSDNDLISVESNVAELLARLPNVVEARRVPLPTFNHIDFLYASDAKVLVYDNVVNSIARHEELAAASSAPR